MAGVAVMGVAAFGKEAGDAAAAETAAAELVGGDIAGTAATCVEQHAFKDLCWGGFTTHLPNCSEGVQHSPI